MIMLAAEISGLPEKGISESLIRRCVRIFGAAAKLKRQSFSLAFVDGPTIRKYNRAYRGKDKVTDVLSFAQADSEFIGPAEAEELGEILICLSRARSQAREYGWSLEREVCRLLIHGLAHLIGYEHEGVSRRIEQKMVRFESGVMDMLGI